MSFSTSAIQPDRDKRPGADKLKGVGMLEEVEVPRSDETRGDREYVNSGDVLIEIVQIEETTARWG